MTVDFIDEANVNKHLITWRDPKHVPRVGDHVGLFSDPLREYLVWCVSRVVWDECGDAEVFLTNPA